MKKGKMRVIRLIAMAMIVVIMTTILPGNVKTQKVMAAPEGKAIKTEEELRNMSMKGEYYLASDIVLTKEWKTLGSFTGVLDGNGYQIKNLVITEPEDDGEGVKLYGMFKELSSGAVVKNLGIEGKIEIPAEIKGIGVTAGLLAATICNDYYVQQNEIRVSNCFVKGKVTSASTLSQQYLGGLAGIYLLGPARNCYSAVEGAAIYGKYTMPDLKYFYTDTTLYKGKLDYHITGKTTEEMKSEQFLTLLNRDSEGVTWIKGEDGYPVIGTEEKKEEEDGVVEVKKTYISTEEELRNVNNDLSGYYVLKNDITVTSGWTMIGSPTSPFTGTFDGNGYVVRNVTYSGDDKHLGMFSYNTGTIKNLGVTGKIENPKHKANDVGGIVGSNTGLIVNCYADMELVPGYAYRHGIIAGDSRTGQIDNCYATGKITKTGTLYPVASVLENLVGMNYFDSTAIPKYYEKQGTKAKTAEEMKSEAFVTLLNERRGDNRKWYYNEGGYPVLRKPKVEVNVDVATLLSNIAAKYMGTTDAFELIDMVAMKQKDMLTNTDAFIAYAADLVERKDSSNFSTDLEKTIIALSALGVDASYFTYGGKTYDAIKVLGEIDMEDQLVNSLIFAINAYDSGNYKADKSALQTKEEILSLLLETQKKDGGFALMGRVGDVDMTAMALHALSNYYIAASAAEAGITEALYEEIKASVDRAITYLSEAQDEEAMFSSSGNANSNSSSMVIVALSALGIDAGSDERFVKEGMSAVEALLLFADADLSGFKWRLTEANINAMATEQAFRALAAYGRMMEEGKAFNIYSYGTIRAERPVEVPTEKPVEKPIIKPEQAPVITPVEEQVDDNAFAQNEELSTDKKEESVLPNEEVPEPMQVVEEQQESLTEESSEMELQEVTEEAAKEEEEGNPSSSTQKQDAEKTNAIPPKQGNKKMSKKAKVAAAAAAASSAGATIAGAYYMITKSKFFLKVLK